MNKKDEFARTASKTIDDLEALANGEMDFDTEDTERFFAHPTVGAKIKTPNGATIRISRVLSPQVSNCEMWVMAEGKVLKAPQCPNRQGDDVTFLVNKDGSICWYEEL